MSVRVPADEPQRCNSSRTAAVEGDLGTALPVKTEVMEEQPFFCDVEIPWVKPEVKNEEDFRPL